MFFSDFIIFSFRKGNQDYFPLKMRKWQKQFKLFAVISSSGVFVLHIFPQWTLRTRSCACARVCILHAYTEKRGGSHWHSQFSGIWSGFLSGETCFLSALIPETPPLFLYVKADVDVTFPVSSVWSPVTLSSVCP